MANDQNNNEKSGGRSAIGILALLLLIGAGGYFGFGPGQGLLPGNGNSTETAQEESVSETQEDADAAKDQEKAEDPQEEEIPDVIVVRIKEDKVTINGHEVANQEELRKYVEEYNSDSRTFVLEEEQSILETYNWVKAVFDELDIQLKNSK